MDEVISIRKISVLIILGLIVICVFIFEPFSSQPPTPTVTASGVVIPTTQGSYCWRGILSEQCVDKAYSSVLDMAAEHKPTIVPSNKEVTIKFMKAPLNGTMVVEQWVNKYNAQHITVKNNKFKAPKEKGMYVYHVMAQWEKGRGNYAFSLEVK